MKSDTTPVDQVGLEPDDIADQFESKELSTAYRQIRAVLPQVILHKVLDYLDVKVNHELAIDVGCGPGLATELLSPYFDKVIGVDISHSQIGVAEEANQHHNVSYICGSCLELPANEESADLIISVVAAHWFDRKKFLAEVDRVLKPGGVLALACHRRFEIKIAGHPELTEKIGNEISKIREELVDKGYFKEEGRASYHQYEFYDDVVEYSNRLAMRDNKQLRYSQEITLEGFMQRLATISAFENCRKMEGDTFINNFRRRLQTMIDQHQANSARMYIIHPWYLAAYKKPS